MRFLSFQIRPEENGMTVREYLSGCLHFSRHQISSLKYRPDGIVVNGQMCRVTRILQEGDALTVGLKDGGSSYLETGGFAEPPDILFENADLLIVNKPAGMVCHPSHGHYADSAANQAAAYAKSKNEDWTIRLIGRLDADTSGILVFAKNSETAARLARQREEGGMRKTYLALCEGSIKQDSGVIDLPIAKDPERLGRMKTDPAGKPAITRYQVLRRGRERTLLRVWITHGRTHQIRVHLASAGHPLVGDPFYGNGVPGKDCAMLHAHTLCMTEPFTGKECRIEAPVPEGYLAE